MMTDGEPPHVNGSPAWLPAGSGCPTPKNQSPLCHHVLIVAVDINVARNTGPTAFVNGCTETGEDRRAINMILDMSKEV